MIRSIARIVRWVLYESGGPGRVAAPGWTVWSTAEVGPPVVKRRRPFLVKRSSIMVGALGAGGHAAWRHP